MRRNSHDRPILFKSPDPSAAAAGGYASVIPRHEGDAGILFCHGASAMTGDARNCLRRLSHRHQMPISSGLRHFKRLAAALEP
ncbi:hypothetical protein B0E45_24900 [Sinorhizobium sp. A49]|nr:hypothetical protein B0E45_24900 [Sinorhizobium sp. A49]